QPAAAAEAVIPALALRAGQVRAGRGGQDLAAVAELVDLARATVRTGQEERHPGPSPPRHFDPRGMWLRIAEDGGASMKPAAHGASPAGGSGAAPGGGVPLPARTYAARSRSYSAGVSFSSSVSPPAWACRWSCLRNGMHQPQPVPAPPHSDS